MKKLAAFLFIILLCLSVSGRYIAPYDDRDLNTQRYVTEDRPTGDTPTAYGPELTELVSINNVFPSFKNISLVSDGNILITPNALSSTITLGLRPDINFTVINIQDLNVADANFDSIGVTQGAYFNWINATGNITITGTGAFGEINAIGDSNFADVGLSGNLWASFLQEGLNEPTGFPNKCSDVTISFTDGTKTFSIQPSGASFDMFHSGIKFTKTAEETLILSDDEGVHYIYYDESGTLQEILAPTTAETEDILENEVVVAALYWDTVANQGIYFTGTNECHGTQMDGATHAHIHFTTGTLFQSGLAIGDIVADDTGDGATHAQISVTDGRIDDEDIVQTITDGAPQNLSAPANLPVFYRSGASNWRKIAATDYPVTITGSGRAAWNEFTAGAWQLTEVTNNQFVLSHIFATNNFSEPVVVIIGQGDYATKTSAREGAATEINNLITSGIGFQEFVPIATIIFQTSNGYSNAVKSRILTTDTGDDYIDWRFQQISPSVVPGDHGNLAGLADNDHAQYVLDTGDWMTGDLNGSYDLNFLNGLFRRNLNIVGDVNSDKIGFGSGSWIDYNGTDTIIHG